MAIDFAALPPEITSSLMYSGAGAGPLMAAATAYANLSAGLRLANASPPEATQKREGIESAVRRTASTIHNIIRSPRYRYHQSPEESPEQKTPLARSWEGESPACNPRADSVSFVSIA